MSLHHVHTPDEVHGLIPANDRPVVVVPVYNSYEETLACYQAFFTHTPADVTLLVVDDHGSDRRPITALLDRFADAVDAPSHQVVLLEQSKNKGFLGTMNDAFAATAGFDVIILNSDVMVGPEWLDRLHEAAYSSSTVATVTALTNHGTIVSVPERNTATDDVPGGLSVDEAARRVAAGSPQLRPRIPTAIGHCTYVRRAALDVVGAFDPAFEPGYGEEVDFSQRAIAAGFEHIVADDVFVFHKGGSSFGRSDAMEQRKLEHEQLIQERYPYYGTWVRRVAADEFSPLAASLLSARRSLLGLVVAIDGLCLGPLPAGTQIVVVETARALARRDDVREVVVFTPTVIPDYVTLAFDGLDKIRCQPVSSLKPVKPADSSDADSVPEKAHVVYRPYQVRDAHEIEWLRSVGDRVVVNQLDFIAYHDAAYFAVDADWRRYRDLAKLAAFAVDGLTYLSEHSRDAARSEGLLPEDKPNKVIYCGTEHTALVPIEPSAPAVSVKPGFLLCLGVSYLHKNRLFTLKLLKELRDDGWDGSLVLAGAHPPDGSSQADEAAYLDQHPELRPHVVDLGMVSEAEKVWLYANTGLVLYPTISEGFGLIPFEAAHYGVPCLSTRQGSLVEVLPAELPIMTSFDAAVVAPVARRLLDDPAAAHAAVQQVLDKGAEFTWAKVADDVMTVLTAVTERPACRVIAIRGEQGPATLTGLRSSRVRSARGAVDGTVAFFTNRPGLRVKIVPPGSKRQELIRTGVHRLRKRL